MKKTDKNKKYSRSALRRQREKEQRYNTILRAAETLFAKKGYHQTSMEEIGDLAEVSAGTVYSYFKNKEDLLISLLKEGGFYFRKMIGDAFQKADASIDGLKNAGIFFFQNFCIKHPEKVTIIFREAVGMSDKVESVRKKLFISMTTDIKEALLRISEGLNTTYHSDLSAELLAVCIAGIYERIATHYLIWGNRSKDLMNIAGEAILFTIGGVESLITAQKDNK
ncbi:MAG: TetR/AcrR family transcriptional regulator [Deltaproteobacteria bacterium]|nr:TetR/AcrR family transcriptional regulator [Deltaproteobacteria bacterium]